MTDSVSSFVVGYGPRRMSGSLFDGLSYREFRKAQGEDCKAKEIVTPSSDAYQKKLLKLYLNRENCVVGRELSAPPDGIWVLQTRGIEDRPTFEFKGKITRILLRENGKESLLIHVEAGKRSIPAFPPMFATYWDAGGGRMPTKWIEFDYQFGKQIHWSTLLTQVGGIPRLEFAYGDRLLQQIAKLYIDHYGNEAPAHAAMRANQLLAEGDVEGERLWIGVMRAIEQFLREQSNRTLQ